MGKAASVAAVGRETPKRHALWVGRGGAKDAYQHTQPREQDDDEGAHSKPHHPRAAVIEDARVCALQHALGAAGRNGGSRFHLG